MSDFKVGEVVDITIKGARVTAVHLPPDDLPEITVYLDCEIGGCPIRLPHRWPMVGVERVAPAEWPPQPGDLWEDRDGFLHFAASYTPDYDNAEDSRGIDVDGCRVVLLSQHSDESSRPGHEMHRPENVIQRNGPLTLVRREGRESLDPATEYCTTPGCGHHRQLHHGNQCVGGNAHDDPCRCTHLQAAAGEGGDKA